MQVYKVFFRILNKQKIRIIMYLAIFLSISVVVSLQGEETQERDDSGRALQSEYYGRYSHSERI